MKKVAFIFLVVFTLVQALPVVNVLFNDSTIVLLIDEEKGEDKKETELKDKKEFSHYALTSTGYSEKMNTAIHIAEAILPCPCLEKLTPPPNFC
jgi:hypothetical protein